VEWAPAGGLDHGTGMPNSGMIPTKGMGATQEEQEEQEEQETEIRNSS
jgi:hypothetical protein